MNNIKYLFTVILVFILSFDVFLPVNAKAYTEELVEYVEIDESSTEIITSGDFMYVKEDGSILIFESQEGLDAYLEYLFQSQTPQRSLRACFPGDPGYPTCNPPVGGTTTIYNRGTGYLNFLFVGYHRNTPVWTKATSYSITTSDEFSVSMSFSYEEIGGSVSVKIAKGVTAHVGANASRFSRLGVFVDISFQKKELVNRNVSGVVTSTYKYIESVVIRNRYIDVVYQ